MLYLARHGETEWNRDGRMQGRTGGPLTEKGRAQARALAAAARALGVRRLVSSTLPRAIETAAIVATALGLAVEPIAELVETDFGACSGLTEAEIAARFPALHDERGRDKWHHRWPGGESYADLSLRLRPAIARGALSISPDTLVVAHQGMNRALAHVVGEATTADVLAMAQPTDVILRLGPGGIAHAQLDELVFRAGLYAGATPKIA